MNGVTVLYCHSP